MSERVVAGVVVEDPKPKVVCKCSGCSSWGFEHNGGGFCPDCYQAGCEGTPAPCRCPDGMGANRDPEDE